MIMEEEEDVLEIACILFSYGLHSQVLRDTALLKQSPYGRQYCKLSTNYCALCQQL